MSPQKDNLGRGSLKTQLRDIEQAVERACDVAMRPVHVDAVWDRALARVEAQVQLMLVEVQELRAPFRRKGQDLEGRS